MAKFVKYKVKAHKSQKIRQEQEHVSSKTIHISLCGLSFIVIEPLPDTGFKE